MCIHIYIYVSPVLCLHVCACKRLSLARDCHLNQSKVLTKPHTGKEKPHPSTATEGSTPCVTKCRRLGGLSDCHLCLPLRQRPWIT